MISSQSRHTQAPVSTIETPCSRKEPSKADPSTPTTTDPNGNDKAYRFEQWVDYLPHDIARDHVSEDVKRASLDVTESHLTESQDEDLWADSTSLEGDSCVMIPHALLIEQDPRLQHELLLDLHLQQQQQQQQQQQTASTCCGNSTTASVTSVSTVTTTTTTATTPTTVATQRRLLWEKMQASQQTRRCLLEPHIQQRASLARVLQSIEQSSISLQRHVLPVSVKEEEEEDVEQEQQKHSDDAADDDTTTAMDICDDEKDQEMLASALSGLAESDVDVAVHGDDVMVADQTNEKEGTTNPTMTSNHGAQTNDDDDVMMIMTTVAEDELPEPPELLTAADIDAADFSLLVRNEQEQDAVEEIDFYDPYL